MRPPENALPARQAGGFSRPLPGFVECGDVFVIEGEAGGQLLVAIVDGLGHGSEAGMAAHAAARTIRDSLELTVVEIVTRCDGALRATRGAALGVLKLDAAGSGEFCGIGNIEVRDLVGRSPGLFCLPGIVGHNVRTLRAMPFSMQRGDIYCLHSDGVTSRGDLRGCLPGTPESVARRIVDAWGRPHDDASAVILGYGAGARLAEAAAAGAPAGPAAAPPRPA
jgi:negative regulator of sigma-B (phosphoserine phosphatase)